MSAFRPALCILAALACLGIGSNAAAYCLARDCDPDAKDGDRCELDPETGCSVDGVPLRWPTGCLTIGFRTGSAETAFGISDDDFEQILLDAFSAWSALDCGDGPPGFIVQSVGAVKAPSVFSCSEVPDANVGVWQFSSDLPGPQVVTSTTGAIAGLTHPAYLADSGELFDADVELNQLWFLAQEPELIRTYVQAVAAHEAGHFLGLAHSQDPDSLMYKSYVVSELRTPTEDDRKGLCKLFPTERLQCDKAEVDSAGVSNSECQKEFEARQSEPEPTTSAPAGCNAGTPPPGAAPSARLWLFLGLLLAYGRRTSSAGMRRSPGTGRQQRSAALSRSRFGSTRAA